MNAMAISIEFDDEASVWVATSDDVPGLATEAFSLEDLFRKLARMVPELIELNRVGEEQTTSVATADWRSPVSFKGE